MTVLAYHLVWTAYGTWLPNDPRGSGSLNVTDAELAQLGPLHYGRKKVQPRPAAVREFYDRAEPLLDFPIVRFGYDQIELVAAGFAECAQEHRYTCWACAILSDHVHLVVRKYRHRGEEVIENLKAASRGKLVDSLPPGHPAWTGGNGYRRFLNSPDEIRTVVRYVERNPIKSGLASQSWSFVVAYDGWSFEPKRHPK